MRQLAADSTIVTSIHIACIGMLLVSVQACSGADEGNTEQVGVVTLESKGAPSKHAPQCAERAATVHYRVTDMGSLASPDDVFAFVGVDALNELGHVVGTSHRPDANNFILFRAYEWHSGVMTELATPDGMQSNAGGINESGTVVGSFGVPSRASRAVVWEGGVMRELGTLGGPFSHADDINDAGEIVGQAQIPGDDSAPIHAFRYASGQMHDLGTFGGTISRALAINTSGQIVGESETDVPGQTRAFLYEDRTLKDIFGQPGRARDINDSGQIVGEIDVWGDTGFLGASGVVYEAGRMTELGLGNSPFAINNTGVVVGTGVGTAGSDPVDPDGFVVRDGKMHFLRDLISECWHTINPVDINDKGQIVASARTCDETARWRVLLLDPVRSCGHGKPMKPKTK